MITERQTYKGLTLDIIDGTTERITHNADTPAETFWHETKCWTDAPSMTRMKAMVDEWEAEGQLDHLPNTY